MISSSCQSRSSEDCSIQNETRDHDGGVEESGQRDL